MRLTKIAAAARNPANVSAGRDSSRCLERPLDQLATLAVVLRDVECRARAVAVHMTIARNAHGKLADDFVHLGVRALVDPDPVSAADRLYPRIRQRTSFLVEAADIEPRI